MSAASIPPYFCDLQKVLQEYRRVTGDGEAMYEKFVQVWDDLKLSYLHYSNPPGQTPQEFLQYLYQAVVLFMQYPYAALVPSTADDLAKGIETRIQGKVEERVVRGGCMYLLYGLYSTQPETNGAKVAIRVPLESEKLVREIGTNEGEIGRAYEALVAAGGFKVVAALRHGPASAPETLEKCRIAKEKVWGLRGFAYDLKQTTKQD